MMLKREATGSQPPPKSAWRKWIRAGSAAVAAAVSAVTLSAGCLDRPVTPQDPATSNIYVAEIRQTAVDKIDLLFMIDNSISMADKQEILNQAVPVLVKRLVTPVCLDAMERPTAQVANPTCPNGTQAEFSPIKDIHIAIVTSSLGGHGGQICDTARGGGDPSEDDKAYPLGRVRPDLTSWDNTGFLAWDPDAAPGVGRPRNTPPGTTNADTLIQQFQNMVSKTGEVGCGYEASLEAWYRFLVEPDPPSRVYARTNENGDPVETMADYTTLDQTILELRGRFLRPDSLVAIIMLTDENDCSIRDERQSWLVGLQTYNGETFRMPRSTTVCATNPNDPCCTSCAAMPPPAGCTPDPVCLDAAAVPLPVKEDNLNLRCYNQKQRFGFDLLQPLQRYVDGLTQPTLPRDPRAVDAEKAAGNPNAPAVKQNPLFAGSQRDRSLIFLAGIVGVPWQDVSTEASWAPNADLEYLSYEELKTAGRLDWMLGPAGGGLPVDGLMFETPDDRTLITNLRQDHPGIGARLAPSSATPGQPNPINGKESNIYDKSDLQFACIFKLATPKTNCENAQSNCDCRPVDADYNRPLCDGTTQTHAKAYPGTRHLQVLRGFGDITNNAIIASICPKESSPSRMNDPSYGYTPAVSAIIERLKEALRGKCLPRPLTACDCDPTTEDCTDRIPCQSGAIPGQVSCSVIEAKQPEASTGMCAACVLNPQRPGRDDPDPAIRPAVERQLKDQGHCGDPPLPACASFCLCEIQQFTGNELEQCQESIATPTNIYGYCYIDPEAAPTPEAEAAATQIVANCPQTQQRLLRFAGDDVPTKGAIALIACLGANVQN